jgi:hypothetical protein
MIAFITDERTKRSRARRGEKYDQDTVMTKSTDEQGRRAGRKEARKGMSSRTRGANVRWTFGERTERSRARQVRMSNRTHIPNGHSVSKPSAPVGGWLKCLKSK